MAESSITEKNISHLFANLKWDLNFEEYLEVI